MFHRNRQEINKPFYSDSNVGRICQVETVRYGYTLVGHQLHTMQLPAYGCACCCVASGNARADLLEVGQTTRGNHIGKGRRKVRRA